MLNNPEAFSTNAINFQQTRDLWIQNLYANHKPVGVAYKFIVQMVLSSVPTAATI